MMKKKILLLPTYFPTKRSPIVGSQIQEQAELLSEDFDMIVLFCLPGIGWKRHLWNSLVSLFTKRQIYVSCTRELIPGKLNARGYYYFQSSLLSGERNQRLKVRAYKTLLDELIQEGWRPDLLHARGHESGGVVAAAFKKIYHVPFILTENVAFVFDDHFSQARLNSYKSVINSADVILYVSSYLMRITLLHGIGLNSRHLVIGNWIDEKEFNILPGVNENRKFTIFTTGYNSYIKDFISLFKAIRYLLDLDRHDVQVVVGVTYYWSEENKRDLIELAGSCGVLEHCRFVYQIPRGEMVHYYNNCDVYVCASLTETFGIAAAEALFCGVPVVSTDNGGVSDYVNDLNGIIVGLRDHKALAEAILLIKKKKLIFDRRAIRSSVLEKFGTEAFRKRQADAYLLALEDTFN
jgi:glycosyltransferase involved in cell wall biosynthesis